MLKEAAHLIGLGPRLSQRQQDLQATPKRRHQSSDYLLLITNWLINEALICFVTYAFYPS